MKLRCLVPYSWYGVAYQVGEVEVADALGAKLLGKWVQRRHEIHPCFEAVEPKDDAPPPQAVDIDASEQGDSPDAAESSKEEKASEPAAPRKRRGRPRAKKTTTES